MKYNILTNILDKISKESHNKYQSYKLTKDNDKNNQIRAKCIIHLFLMVRFGIDDFVKRESYITEGGYDGGIDAYYIDEDNKVIYLIQSKYRTNVTNFEHKEISIDEIIKMDLGRILKGEKSDEKGNDYNGKICGLQRIYGKLPELGLYRTKVVFLCNLTSYTDEKIKRLIDNFDFEVFNYQKIYNNLVFPLLTSTYYDVNSLDITINLDKKEIPHLRQEINTSVGTFDITVVFVPTIEIAKVMSKYKNALLTFNPRNYLSLDKNDVNKEIKKSILDLSTGEFAIFNNGITIFADSGNVNTATGRQSIGTVTIRKPQIINGGQTAFTLSKLYENGTPKESFDNKEVMLKIISPNYQSDSSTEKNDRKIIKNISRSTNQQSKIEEADMRANDDIQIDIQKTLFEKYGLLYERKRGEFDEALSKKLVDRKHLIKRDELVISYLSFKGEPGKAKNSKNDSLFEEKIFNTLIDNLERIDDIVLSVLLYQKITDLEKKYNKSDLPTYGHALKYGKNAMIYMYSIIFNRSLDELNIDKNLNSMLNQWKSFEDSFYQANSKASIFNEYRNISISKHISEYSSIMKQSIEKCNISLES